MNENKSNPIDKDKTTDQPHLLPYAHHVGSAIIKPIDKGRVKGVAMTAMYQQTEDALMQIKEQVELLLNRAQKIHDRIDISEKIYRAEIGFETVVNQTYYLYERENGKWIMSLIAPEEWGRTRQMHFVAAVRLLADKTWELVRKADNIDI